MKKSITGIIEELEKGKYTKRTGTPGHYKYEYGEEGKTREKNPEGTTGGKLKHIGKILDDKKERKPAPEKKQEDISKPQNGNQFKIAGSKTMIGGKVVKKMGDRKVIKTDGGKFGHVMANNVIGAIYDTQEEAEGYIKRQQGDSPKKKQEGSNKTQNDSLEGEDALTAVKEDGRAIRFVKNPTPEIALAAIKEWGPALEYIKNPTHEMALAAVKEWGPALKFVKNQTPEIALAAVKKDGTAIRFVKTQTPEIALASVKNWGPALEYIKAQTPEIALAAVKQDGDALKFVKNQTDEITEAAIEQDDEAIRFVRNTKKNQFKIAEKKEVKKSFDDFICEELGKDKNLK